MILGVVYHPEPWLHHAWFWRWGEIGDDGRVVGGTFLVEHSRFGTICAPAWGSMDGVYLPKNWEFV